MTGEGLRFGLLGPLLVRAGTRTVVVPGPRQRQALALLLLHPNRRVGIAELIAALWDEDPPDTARRQVLNAVSQLRQALARHGAATAVASEPEGYRLRLDADRLDLLRFQALAADGRRLAAAGDPTGASRALGEALALWRGPPLAGLPGAVFARHAARLDELRLATVEDSMEQRLAAGEQHALVPELTGLLAEHALRERLAAALMLALYRAGRQADALAVYRTVAARLVEELGMDPSSLLHRRLEAILRRDPELEAAPAPTPAGAPSPVAAAASAAVTPRPAQLPATTDLLVGRAAPGPAHRPVTGPAVHCLPRPATHFSGRGSEVAGLLAAIERRQPGRPLVIAVDGMAGVGKTALTMEVAHRVADRYPCGQLFVDLYGHSAEAPIDPSVALGLLLGQLGVPGDELPDALEARAARWRSELATRPVLAVLDNAAGSDQVRPLMPGLSSALVLVTSRRRLAGLDADEHVTLDPLDEPAAVSLLAGLIGEQRLNGYRGEGREVARLCGYLPLALRIAAARLRHRPSWTVADLAERLRAARPPVVELSAEGMTVATALTLSYRQLSEPARRLLRGLGLHGGEDFDEHAAAALLDATPADVQPWIDELLDAHLVHDSPHERYRLHDLVRDYAGRLAAETDDEPARRETARRLLDYYLHSLVADLPDGTVIDGLLVPDWGPPSPHRRMFATETERIRWEEVEWRNVLAAADLAERLGLDRHVCLLARAAWGYHWRRGNADILISLHRAALAAARRLGDPHLTAMAHNYVAGAYARCGRMSESRTHLAQALQIWHAAGADTAELLTRVNLITVNMQAGRYDDVLADGRHVLDRPDRPEDDESARRRIAINRAAVLRMLGECHVMLGQYGTALHYLRQAVHHYADVGGQGYRWAFILFEMGRAHARLGHRVVAPLLFRRALSHYEKSGNETGAAEVLAELGLIHWRAGRPAEARHLHESAVERTDRAGSPQGRCYALNRLGGTLARMGDAGSAAALHRQALTIARRVEARYEEAVAHAGLATALAEVDPETAGRHRDEGERLFAAMRAVDPYHVATVCGAASAQATGVRWRDISASSSARSARPP